MEKIDGHTERDQMRRRRTRKRQPIGKKGLAHTDTRIFPIAAAGICLFSLSVGAAFLGGGGRSFLTGGPAGQGREAVQETEAALLGKSFYERELVMAPEDYANVAISQVTDYVNIRQEATTASPVVGKLYNNCAATILGPVNGQGGVWYQIRSGTVSGYVKAQYFITGAQAEAIAKNVGTEYATINTSALRLRSEPNLTSEVLTTLKQGAEYVVLEEKDGFARLSVDADMEGYVSMDYIKIRVDFKQAVSLEEEAAKQAEETRRRQEAAEAIQKWQDVKMVEAKADSTGGSSGQSGTPGGGSAQDGERAPAGAGEDSGAPSVHQISRTDGGGADPAARSQTIAASPVKEDGKEQVQAPAQGTAQAAGGAAVTSKALVGTGGSGSPGGQTAGPGGGSGSGGAAGPGGASGPGGSAAGPGGAAAPDGSSSAITSATRTAIVAYAKQFLGNPYVYGGSSLTNGADCSGFVMRIYEHFGIDTGRSSRDQAANGQEIKIDAVQPGDLLFYASGSTINHVAIYIGGGQVIHAASAKSGIMISPWDYRTPCKAATFLD